MRLVFLSDMHVGHRVALADPTESPGNCPGKPVQKAFYKIWEEAVGGPWGEPDALVAVGDLVEGLSPKEGGSELWTTDLETQATHSVDLLKMWHAKRYYIIRGSKYHVQVNNSGVQIEEQLARELGAEEYPLQEHVPKNRRQHSGWHWYLSFNGVTFHVGHYIGVSRVFHYRSTPIARQMLNMKLNDALRHEYELILQQGLVAAISEYKTRVVVRAHAHYYWECASSHSMGIDLPCWQALAPFQQKLGALDISPDIGFVGFEIQKGGKMRHEPVLWQLEDVQRAPHTIVRIK